MTADSATYLAPTNPFARLAAYLGGGVVLLIAALMFYWDHEPDLFDVHAAAVARVGDKHALVTGVTTVATLLKVSETLLDKRGGYLDRKSVV